MLLVLFMLAVTGPTRSSAKSEDPVICRRDTNSEVGTHMRPSQVCMKKSDWDIIEKNTQNELQSLHERSSFDPGMASGHKPN